MGRKPRILPALEPGETYNDADFLLVRTNTDCYGASTTVIDRMLTAKRDDDSGSWICKTVANGTKISHEAALAMAREFADKHEIPVIYQEHIDERATQQFEWNAAAGVTAS